MRWFKRTEDKPTPKLVLGGLAKEADVPNITWRWIGQRGNYAVVELVENTDPNPGPYVVGVKAEIPLRDLIAV